MISSSSQQFSEHEQAVQIPCGSIILQGELAIPTKAAGLVLFVHGSGSGRLSPRNQYVARVIREFGIGTLLFDLLTADEETQDNVTSQFRFDIPFLTRRLVEVTEWVMRHRPQHEIGYFGASTGGGAALAAAAEFGNRLGAVVSRGGRPDLAGRALPFVLAPTLLIVGEYDDAVIKLNEQAFGQLQCPKALSIVPRATHLFAEPGALEEVARLAAHWFQRHLRADRPSLQR